MSPLFCLFLHLQLKPLTISNSKLLSSLISRSQFQENSCSLLVLILCAILMIHAQYYRSWRLTIKLKDVHSENDEVITGLASIIKVKVKLTPGTIRVVRRSLPAANGFWNFCRSPTLATSGRSKGYSWSKLSSQSWAHHLKMPSGTHEILLFHDWAHSNCALIKVPFIVGGEENYQRLPLKKRWNKLFGFVASVHGDSPMNLPM